ncbi:hypothetical protein L873DRAFT_1839034 [Choiromyces venosus 120613-1]|uniref:DUF7881 domain-containing protein n=1 Tax=Choiromyces venosus 120613-1 TaxID=1336337 RepID=A0A3N4IVF8_9PEZI|nr:hypothetical protein L873DRAFT_1839034 [Choiromyces venosus 120613-1]
MSLNRFLPHNNRSITEANFLDILGILLVVDGSPLHVQERISSHIVSRTDVPLDTGVYDIHYDVSNDAWIRRIISHNVTGRRRTFRHRIHNRDWKCVISGIVIDMHDAAGSSKIISSQNDFLRRADVHQMFNQYLVSVNPDDGYKVVVFTIDRFGLDGRILDPVCRSPVDPHHHFRQSAPANMRGAGEPIFKHVFPPGTDMVGEILAGPYAQERFELEIAARLREVS